MIATDRTCGYQTVMLQRLLRGNEFGCTVWTDISFTQASVSNYTRVRMSHNRTHARVPTARLSKPAIVSGRQIALQKPL